MNKVAVIGSGAWGTALADILANNKFDTYIYGIMKDEIDEINLKHTNSKYFDSKYTINKNIKGTLSLDEAIKDAYIIVLAIPSFAMKEVINNIKKKISKDTILVNVAKGFDKDSNKTFSCMIKDLFGEDYNNNLVNLVGPSFAEEVVEHQYTAITAYSDNLDKARDVQKAFSNDYFRVYTSTDVIGAEYCSALKNVIALASGIIDGLGCKVNSRAALIARGLTEISRYVTHFGGNLKTCYGLAGIGDLTLTCSSTTSRNYSAGYIIGKEGTKYFFENNKKTVEGIYACQIAYKIAKNNNIYSPIIDSVYNVLFNNASPKDKLLEMMNNALKDE